MFRIERDTLYSLTDLEGQFEALGMTARQFLDRVRPPKLFRNVWRGADILEALDRHRQARETERQTLERLPQRRGRPCKVKAQVEQIRTPKA